MRYYLWFVSHIIVYQMSSYVISLNISRNPAYHPVRQFCGLYTTVVLYWYFIASTYWIHFNKIQTWHTTAHLCEVWPCISGCELYHLKANINMPQQIPNHDQPLDKLLLYKLFLTLIKPHKTFLYLHWNF